MKKSNTTSVRVQGDVFTGRSVNVKVDTSMARRCGICKNRLAGGNRELCKSCWLNPDVQPPEGGRMIPSRDIRWCKRCGHQELVHRPACNAYTCKKSHACPAFVENKLNGSQPTAEE